MKENYVIYRRPLQEVFSNLLVFLPVLQVWTKNKSLLNFAFTLTPILLLSEYQRYPFAHLNINVNIIML